MIRIRRAADRGHANHGWLDAHHTFSFADYHDPEHMQFGPLRVLNQDRIQAGQGFPTHGHRDMEIVTYVLDGTLEHKDNMGNGSRITPGDVQFMSAGSGVTHSEFNPSPDEALELLQMWILPSQRGNTPRYEQRHFPSEERNGTLCLVVSPDGEHNSLTIGQDARLYVGHLDAGQTVQHSLAPGRSAWVHLARGRALIAGETLEAGDGLAVSDESALQFEGLDNAELVVWDLPQEQQS